MTEQEKQETMEISRIDAPYRKAVTEDVIVDPGSGVQIETWVQMVEVAKVMARAGIALPPHARDNPSVCFAIMQMAMQWRLPNAFFVAQHSYVVTNRGGIETMAYDSAIFQAVLLASRAIIGRPQYAYEGQDEDRRCTVTVQDRQTGNWEELTTPPIKKCRGNSPLWANNPDQQLAYFGLRNLVRLKYQDVLGGFYDKDEFDDLPVNEPSSPNLLERLPGRMDGEGFKPTHGEAVAQEQAALNEAGKQKSARSEAMRRAWKTRKENAAKKQVSTEELLFAEETTKTEADNEAQEAGQAIPDDLSIPASLRQEPAPTASTSPPRWAPTTQAEYIEYAQRCIKGFGVAQLRKWFTSDPQVKLRQDCQVNDITYNSLVALIKEREAQEA